MAKNQRIKYLFLTIIYWFFWLCEAQFRDDCLIIHNEYRAKHGVPFLTEHQKLCENAARWAQNLSAQGPFDPLVHQPNNEYGENLYKITSGRLTARNMLDSWYNEGKNYDYNNPKFATQTSNFTQLLWKSTKNVCCQLAIRGRTSWGVCEYYPKGNVEGQFKENVLPSKTNK